MRHKTVLICFLVILLASCAGSKLTQTVGLVPSGIRVALAPSGGVLADAIGIELFNGGWTVIDTQQMSNMMLRYNMTEIELSKPENLKILKDQGIDGILSVRAGKPQSATARINSTKSWGEIIAGVSWQNGWGGAAGSIADRSMRKDITGAAKEIVDALTGKRPGGDQ